MAQAAKSQEPSMEEILASIRRIIAEDDSDKVVQRPAAAAGVDIGAETIGSSLAAPRSLREAPPQETSPGPNSSPDEIAKTGLTSTIFDLTETSSPRAEPVDSSLPPMPVAPIEEAAADDRARQTSSTADDERGRLVSSATSAAVDPAFNALAQTVLVHNARTLEDLVREMLRPMLKVWLDDNLPGMVERLVRAEIERVSRGR